MIQPTPEHSKISPTAKMVAYWRQFSDIPFAREVAKLVHAEDIVRSFLDTPSQAPIESMLWFAPMIEARYKSMVSAIRRKNIKQVLELASGVSLRGLAMTLDPEIRYVETDLPGMSEEKKAVVKKILEIEHISERPNLFFREANVLKLEELEAAVAPFFENRPIAIIHEGLFQYLSFEEKELAANNILKVLGRFGGVWMTPDLNTKEDLDRQENASDPVLKGIEAATQRSFWNFAFDTCEHTRQFFERLGFEVHESSQLDCGFELTSIKNLGLSPDVLDPYKEGLKIWTLSAKEPH